MMLNKEILLFLIKEMEEKRINKCQIWETLNNNVFEGKNLRETRKFSIFINILNLWENNFPITKTVKNLFEEEDLNRLNMYETFLDDIFPIQECEDKEEDLIVIDLSNVISNILNLNKF